MEFTQLNKKIMLKYKKITTLIVFVAIFASLFSYGLANAASLKLSPQSGDYNIGDVFDVRIIADTGGADVDGIDIHYLRFDHNKLEVVDSDPNLQGVQIKAGSLLPTTVVNLADNTSGRIDFSQISLGGDSFSGSGILATIKFKVLTDGAANVNFDFSLGETSDCNIAAGGADILSSVKGAAFNSEKNINDTIPPSDVSGLTVSSGDKKAVISWENPSDSDFKEVIIVRNEDNVPNNMSDGLNIYRGDLESYTDNGLTNGKNYYYKIFACDQTDNCSAGVGFVAAPKQQEINENGNPPKILNITSGHITETASQICWQVDKAASSTIVYDTNLEPSRWQKNDPMKLSAHCVNLSGLLPGTDYYYYILNEDSAGNVSKSEIRAFTTKESGKEGANDNENKDENNNNSQNKKIIETLKQEIALLIERINQLKAQLAELKQLPEKKKNKKKETVVKINIPYGFRFKRNLYYGEKGKEITYLQVFLRNQGRLVYPEGKVTGYFGPLTKRAVIRFQNKYYEDVLLPWGMKKGTGIVGRTTRIKMNEILASQGR